ncbi:MAG: hypothetical protein PWR13_804 [Archaeoglobi archaeon]|nr:hypothetical protein [Archaeoglobi archaeon]
MSSSSLREFPFEKRLEIAQREGFRLMEINLNYDPLETVKPFKDYLSSAPLLISIHSNHDRLNFSCSAESSLRILEEEISLAEEIGASYYIFHVTKDGNLDEIIEFLKEVLPKNIPAIYENSGVGNGASEEDIEKILKTLNVGMNLDVGHLWRALHNGSLKGGIQDFLRRFRKRIKYLHLHDNDGIHDHHWAIGRGSVPFEIILHELNLREVPLVIETRGSYEDVRISKEVLKKWITFSSP